VKLSKLGIVNFQKKHNEVKFINLSELMISAYITGFVKSVIPKELKRETVYKFYV